ncbi:hypothetical protein KAFR_0E03390 [Kazachstania africana CBS 2517]|uniref:Derlin n=1 Tax=Kazachstania africana (strain ATCC 22294 / BCRC 22015 / CBS 2517 / CECT 1963 / NBRC 1671 / NRRL Y-8276) TaxID=1071382 RepID=H2AVU1_KAZAF|nr:hypothetical protein KAFR_0E03390 [Kazachstania africana CBS 2517]CCF58491.1 hypothetical protein KAFR_0E03390 [Kazachstania africana CBS 2517]
MTNRNIHTLNGSARSNRSSSSNDATISDIWFSVPPVTRTLVLMLGTVTSLAALQLVQMGYLVFQWNETFRHFQFWRIITACMVLPLQAMPALFEIYNITTRSLELERQHFMISSVHDPSIDYAFYLLFSILSFTNMATFFEGRNMPMILTSALSSCITFTWAVDNRNNKVLFYGVIPVYGKFFPLIQLVISFIFGEGFMNSLVGICTGYLFVCLDTRTFGPLWGYIFKKEPLYGIMPCGKLSSPSWFKYTYETLFLSIKPEETAAPTTSSKNAFLSKFTGQGQKLGGKKTPVTRAGRLVREDTPNDSGSSTGTDATTDSTTTGSFRGKGQRVGTK